MGGLALSRRPELSRRELSPRCGIPIMPRARPMPRLVVIVALLLVSGCRTTLYQASFHRPGSKQLDATAPFLKAHTVEGEVYVLTDWRVNDAQQLVTGTGLRYDRARQIIDRGQLRVHVQRIVLLETNRPEMVATHNQFAALTLMSVISLGLTAYCIVTYPVCFTW